MRLFPLFLCLAVTAAFVIANIFGSVIIVFWNLGELSFFAFLFLFLVALVCELKNKTGSIITCFSALCSSFTSRVCSVLKIKKASNVSASGAPASEVKTPETKIKESGAEAAAERQVQPEQGGGLVKLSKDDSPKQEEPEEGRKTILSSFFIVSFLGLVIWQVVKIVNIIPLPYSTNYSGRISDALILLVFPCAASIYLNITKNKERHDADKTSFGILTFLSAVFVFYAVFTAAKTVLNIDIGILKWVYVLAVVYLAAALSVNVIISIFRKDITGSFNYTFFPKRKYDGAGFFDSDEVKQNYSIKSLYTVKYALRILPALLLLLGLVLFLSTAVFVVQPYQEAAVYRFGKLRQSSIAGQGLHFKLPWPIDIAEIYDVHRLNSMQIGYISSGESMDYLWTRSHDGGEYLLLLGNGNEVAAINMKITYNISDLYSYITTSADPESVLSAAAYELLLNRTIYTTLDTILSVDRDLLSSSLRNELSVFCEKERLGISVVQIIIESIHPPVEAAEVYQRVVTASVEKNAVTTIAYADADKIIIDAQRQSAAAVMGAMAEQFFKVSAAQNEMDVYYGAMDAYRINPESFRLYRYLQMFETVVSGNKVFVFSPGAEGSISNSFIGRANIMNISNMEER